MLCSIAPMPSIPGSLGLTAQWTFHGPVVNLGKQKPGYSQWLSNPANPGLGICKRSIDYNDSQLIPLPSPPPARVHWTAPPPGFLRSTWTAQQTTGEATPALESSFGTPRVHLLVLLVWSSPLASQLKLQKPTHCNRGGSFCLGNADWPGHFWVRCTFHHSRLNCWGCWQRFWTDSWEHQGGVKHF